MSKSGFRVTANPFGGYGFSFARCHAAESGAYITVMKTKLLLHFCEDVHIAF